MHHRLLDSQRAQDQARDELAAKCGELAEQKLRAQSLSADRAQLQNKLNISEKGLKAATDANNQTLAQLRSKEQALKTLEKQGQANAKDLADLKLTLAAEQNRFCKMNSLHLDKIDELERQLSVARDAVELQTAERAQLEQQPQQGRDSNAQLSASSDQLSKQLAELTEDRDSLQRQVDVLVEGLHRKRRRELQLEESVAKKSRENAELQQKMDSLTASTVVDNVEHQQEDNSVFKPHGETQR